MNKTMMVTGMYMLAMLFLHGANAGGCTFPCRWGVTEYKGTTSGTLRLIDSFTVALDQFGFSCIIREGQFYIVQVSTAPGTFSCLKVADLSKKCNTFTVYFTNPQENITIPSVCDICKPDLFNPDPDVWIDVRLENTPGCSRDALEGLNCNVPFGCESRDPYDTKCTGCEKDILDDGLCCDCGSSRNRRRKFRTNNRSWRWHGNQKRFNKRQRYLN